MNWPHRNFHGKRYKEGQEYPELLITTQLKRMHTQNVEGATFSVHIDQRDQHEHRTEKGIQEEFDRGIDATRTTPDTDNQEHWNKRGFEKHVEQDGIECRENTDHQARHD